MGCVPLPPPKATIDSMTMMDDDPLMHRFWSGKIGEENMEGRTGTSSRRMELEYAQNQRWKM
jgi:hypothetical protein